MYHAWTNKDFKFFSFTEELTYQEPMDLPHYCIEKYTRFNDMSAFDGMDKGTDVGTMQNADSDSDCDANKYFHGDSKPSKPAAVNNGTFGKQPMNETS
jgi:hypothetical protein